jgi:hypothetical protein
MQRANCAAHMCRHGRRGRGTFVGEATSPICCVALHHQPPRSARCHLASFGQLGNFTPKVADFLQDLLKLLDDLLVRRVLCRCHCLITSSLMATPHGTHGGLCTQADDQSQTHSRRYIRSTAHMCRCGRLFEAGGRTPYCELRGRMI